MKQNITLLLIVLLNIVTGKAWAYDAEIDGVYYNFNGGEAYVTNSELYVGNPSKYVGKVVIPEQVTYQGTTYKVTTIMEAAFINSTNELISVVLPNSLVTIGKRAFSGCRGLVEMTIPNSVKTIEEKSFQFCENLKKMSLGNAIEYIGDYAFNRCDGITSIDLPNTLTHIGQHALPTNVTSINIPTSLTVIPKYGFYGMKLKTVVIPNGVTTIEEFAFSDDELESITIPSSVTSIAENAFGFGQAHNDIKVHISSLEAWLKIPFGTPPRSEWDNWGNIFPFGNTGSGKSYSLYLNGKLLTDVVIPESITKIPAFAFYGCRGIKTVNMHNAVTEIVEGAFEKCGNLESVVISNSVTTIGRHAFFQDTIQSLTIGANVQEIGDQTFDSNYGISSDNVMKTIWLANTAPKNYENAAGVMNYVSNNQYSFKDSPYRKRQTLVYPLLSSMFAIDGVKYVPVSMADRTCEAIDAVYDESASLTKLGTDVTFRNVKFKVNYVRPYTCSGNSFVKKVELGEGLPFIEDHVFDGCTNMQSVKLAESVAWLGVSSFKNCASLKEIAIPAATTEVRHNAFKGCTSLQNVTMNDGSGTLTLQYNFDDKVNDKPFDYMTNAPLFEDCPLDKVYIGRNIAYGTSKNEGYSPFYRNSTLRKVEITDRETEVGENEFYGCTGLKSVKIGDGVTTFGNWAFSGCSSLDYFEFGSSVMTIGTEAFSDCSKVTRIISHAATPPACGSQAMDDINKWDCTLIVPDGSTAAYQQASQWKEFLFVEDLSAGIELPTTDAAANAPVYSLSGQRLKAPRKGINIVGGRKVVVK